MKVSKNNVVSVKISSHVPFTNKVFKSSKIPKAKVLGTEFSDKVEFLKGKFKITFEPIFEKLLEEKLVNSFSLLNLADSDPLLKTRKDLKLIVKGQPFDFNLEYLAKISSMFQEMFEHCLNDETKAQWARKFKNS